MRQFPSIAEVIGYIMLIVVVAVIIVAVIMNSPEKGEIFIVPDENVPEKIESEKQSRLHLDGVIKARGYLPGMYYHDGFKVRNYG